MRIKLVIIVALSLLTACRNVARFPIAEPDKALLDDRITGRWKFHEDTNSRNFYEIIPRRQPYMLDRYHLKFWNRNGTNPTYEGNMHFSKIDGVLFANVPYFEDDFTHQGFIFLRILDINATYDEVTAAVVGDTTLWLLNSQAEVRERIQKNMNKPSFYSDTFNFYKMGTGSDAVPMMNIKK